MPLRSTKEEYSLRQQFPPKSIIMYKLLAMAQKVDRPFGLEGAHSVLLGDCQDSLRLKQGLLTWELKVSAIGLERCFDYYSFNL